jgi:pimeloyl-ACP methyl ester carboxylesterase
MAGGAKAQFDCIREFSETDFTCDLQAITVPVLLLHGEDEQIIPIGNSARKAIGLVRDGTLKTSRPVAWSVRDAPGRGERRPACLCTILTAALLLESKDHDPNHEGDRPGQVRRF